jgi:SAM-dependent methyltransferase
MSYRAFSAHADQYDVWFDSEPGATIFATEVECLRPFLHSYPIPYLEVGVGSGRFAQALGIEYGVDPSLALLIKAKTRDINVIRARGEKLPFASGSFGGALLALTLCFVNYPLRALQEVSRVLVSNGGLVLGLILKESPWAESYMAKAKEGHPIYSQAQFFSRNEVESLLHQSGFDNFHYCSVLSQPPEQGFYYPERPLSVYRKSSGFTSISASKV